MNLPVSKEQKNEALSLFMKSVIGFVPGGHIIDELVDFRANVQQERLTKFSEFLKQGFENVTEKSFDPENLKTEEFIDAFEIIIRKVASTGSEAKLKRYRNVLLKAMYERTDAEMFFKYVSLIEDISETQVLILSVLSRGGNQSESDIMRNLSDPNKLYDYMKTLLDKNEFTLKNGQTIPVSEVQYYIHDLKSKGIISVVPEKPRQIQLGDTIGNSKELYKLSPIGSGFLSFIEEYGKE